MASLNKQRISFKFNKYEGEHAKQQKATRPYGKVGGSFNVCCNTTFKVIIAIVYFQKLEINAKRTKPDSATKRSVNENKDQIVHAVGFMLTSIAKVKNQSQELTTVN